MSEQNAPFVTLGRHLKYVREQSRESLAEASGAVEIDEQALERIELGRERPSEDVLLLLISHFGVEDHEAIQLWELAEYQSELPDQLKPESNFSASSKSVVMLLAMDLRTMYSDGLEVSTNQAGIVLNFTQATGKSKAAPVAHIGMSYEQAERVLATLQTSLLKAKYQQQPKALPPHSSRFSDQAPHAPSSPNGKKDIEGTAL